MYSPNPALPCISARVRTHTHTMRAVLSGQTSESGSSELNFHVVSGPGELVYRAKNQPRSFNYRLSVASECVATSLNGKWDEAGGRWHPGQRASTLSCCNSFLHRFETFPSASCCLSHSPPCKWEICSDLANKANHTRSTPMSSNDNIVHCFVMDS